MSDIDFQNGFICGMATRGLTKSDFSSYRQQVAIKGAIAKLPAPLIVGLLLYKNSYWGQGKMYGTSSLIIESYSPSLNKTHIISGPNVSGSCI